jgi:hypothetical protein
MKNWSKPETAGAFLDRGTYFDPADVDAKEGLKLALTKLGY